MSRRAWRSFDRGHRVTKGQGARARAGRISPLAPLFKASWGVPVTFTSFQNVMLMGIVAPRVYEPLAVVEVRLRDGIRRGEITLASEYGCVPAS
jgi:hypothetical protein